MEVKELLQTEHDTQNQQGHFCARFVDERLTATSIRRRKAERIWLKVTVALCALSERSYCRGMHYQKKHAYATTKCFVDFMFNFLSMWLRSNICRNQYFLTLNSPGDYQLLSLFCPTSQRFFIRPTRRNSQFIRL